MYQIGCYCRRPLFSEPLFFHFFLAAKSINFCSFIFMHSSFHFRPFRFGKFLFQPNWETCGIPMHVCKWRLATFSATINSPEFLNEFYKHKIKKLPNILFKKSIKILNIHSAYLPHSSWAIEKSPMLSWLGLS